jgi:putative inorganic carbon (HCO3(-)) transporter
MNSTIADLPRSSSYNFIFRQEVWRVGVQAIGESPLTGVGLGSFRQVFTTDYVTIISPDIDIAHAHNIFLQVALDVGLPGLAAYLAILIIAFRVGWQTIQEDKALKPLAISLLASLIGFHIYSLTDAISFGSKTHFVFWLTIGLLAGMRQMSKLASETSR